jgi:hypothetical protein
MNFVFVICFCIIFGSITNGGWIGEQTSVDEEETSVGQDAAELTRLFEDFWALKPDVFYEEGPLVICQFLDQCCENVVDRSRAISILFDASDDSLTYGNFEKKAINECVNTTDLSEAIQSCPPIRHVLYPVFTEKERSDAMPYGLLLLKYTDVMNKIFKKEDGLCTNEEEYAILCSRGGKLIENCFSKTLQDMYDKNDLQVYQKFVTEAKQNLTTAYQQAFQLEMKRMQKEMKPILRIFSKYNSRKT